ncbi:hypothetical protein DFH08DRAFT_864518 [Mycena albidolilacea]|uniref:Uncharacterized protein n=1 Tax=Mycena albidolilacea TaxID=1033008 RepID=A0AAD7ESZ3_9AGAR|nr:hypothetical protein DFH08DRAFT_864518 [Mycena albidolilacea]
MATKPSGQRCKLRDVFITVGTSATPIDLPRICVLGSQSSGKSRVLDAPLNSPETRNLLTPRTLSGETCCLVVLA